MRPVAFLTVLALAGCSQPTPPLTPAGPNLRYLATGFDEDAHPLAFVVNVVNDGDAPALVDSVNLHVDYRVPIFDDDFAGEVPDGFDCRLLLFAGDPAEGEPLTPLGEGETIAIGPLETRDLAGLVEWVRPPDAPPMLAVVRGSFSPRYKGETLAEGARRLFILQSRPGTLELILDSMVDDEQLPKALLRDLEGHRGKPVAGLSGLPRSD